VSNEWENLPIDDDYQWKRVISLGHEACVKSRTSKGIKHLLKRMIDMIEERETRKA
jgi:hypothetical protein